MNCIFCNKIIKKEKPILENSLALAYYDQNPVSKSFNIL